jgi:hypothetical protein
MNKEQQELVNEAYQNYVNKTKFPGGDTVPKIEFMYPDSTILTQESFINKCKTDTEFSEKWGLKIEERELTWDESNEYYNNHQSLKVPYLGLKVPTKLITITYNDKTIESYE